jgi:hypothetical protein
MKKPAQKWRPILDALIDKIRIVSREETAALGEEGTKLKLWTSQESILNEICLGMDEGIRDFNILKSRQLGSSTIFEIVIILWLSLHPRIKGALVVDQDKTRDKFREELRNMILSIPARFGGLKIVPKGGDNRFSMKFTNGSQLDFLVAGTGGSKVSWGESSGYTFAILTEIASYGNEEGIFNFLEALSDNHPDRLLIKESTAKGHNHWRDIWVAGQENPLTTKNVFVGWWSKHLNSISKLDPKFSQYGLMPPDEREFEKIKIVEKNYGWKVTPEQLAWYRWYLAKDGKTDANAAQNQPWYAEEAFVLTGNSFFPLRMIAKDYERMPSTFYQGYRFYLSTDFWETRVEHIDAVKNPERKNEVEMRVWEQPCPEGIYVIGCDPAYGSDERNDRHAVQVWRCFADKIIQVCEWASNEAETRQCAWVLAYLAGTYRNCMVNIELTGGYGHAVLTEFEHLKELMRAEMSQGKTDGRGRMLADFLDTVRHYIYRKADHPGGAGYIIHTNTTMSVKGQVFNQFRDAYLSGRAIVNSRPMLQEMQIIVQNGDRIAAPGRQKDDRTMASCLAVHAYIQHYRDQLVSEGMTFDRATRENREDDKISTAIGMLVLNTMKQIAEGQTEEPDPAQQWMIARGLV